MYPEILSLQAKLNIGTAVPILQRSIKLLFKNENMTPHHVTQAIEQKITAGLQPISGKTIVHTAPHHDDILLGYFPYVLRNLQGNKHHVVYVTSGANGVSDQFLSQHLAMTQEQVAQLDPATKQELKFAIREAESEKKWALVSAYNSSAVEGSQHVPVTIYNFRAQFYGADEHEMDDAMQRDVQRMVDYLHAVQPDIITMLVDPMGIGPQSHHRSAQVLQAAIAQLNFSHPITILGYRNVWSTFTHEQASMIVPVTDDELAYTESIFTTCFRTQAGVLIAGDELRNFAQEASEIQKAQYDEILSLLGRSCKDYQAAIFLQQHNFIAT